MHGQMSLLINHRFYGYTVWGRLHVPLTRDNGSLGLVPRGYHPPGLVTQSGVRDDDGPLVSPPCSRSFLLMVADSLQTDHLHVMVLTMPPASKQVLVTP